MSAESLGAKFSFKGIPRDPARIPVVLKALRLFWEQHPDWRLGQTLVNLTQSIEAGPEMFHLEDDRLLEILRNESL